MALGGHGGEERDKVARTDHLPSHAPRCRGSPPGQGFFSHTLHFLGDCILCYWDYITRKSSKTSKSLCHWPVTCHMNHPYYRCNHGCCHDVMDHWQACHLAGLWNSPGPVRAQPHLPGAGDRGPCATLGFQAYCFCLSNQQSRPQIKSQEFKRSSTAHRTEW